MACANIDLMAPVAANNLSRYGAGKGGIDVCPSGVVVFGVATAALTAGATVYVTAAGDVSTTSAVTSAKGVVQCNAAIGDGVWVLLLGITSGANPAWVVPAMGAAA